MKHCEWCSDIFKPSVSYQVYCSADCREYATKEKIVERHKEIRRQRRNSKPRKCAGSCGTVLSMYNDHKYCNNCFINNREVTKKIKQVRTLFHDYEAIDES